MSLQRIHYLCKSLLLMTMAQILAACAPEPIKQSMQLADQLKQEGQLYSHQMVSERSSLHYMASCDIRPLTGREDICERHPEVLRILVFIHGTPGDWSVFSPQLADKRWGEGTLLLSLDRPGWGQSALDSERIEPSLAQQARGIAPLLQQLKQQFLRAKLYVVGHSLGATLAPMVAMESPDLVDGVVAIAGDLSTGAFSPRWYNHMANWPLIRSIIPRDMCFANEEVLALKTNLQEMELNFPKLISPMLVLQGGKDKLVDPKNAELVKNNRIPGGVSVVMYPEWGHLMHLEQVEVINSEMHKWIQQQEQAQADKQLSRRP